MFFNKSGNDILKFNRAIKNFELNYSL